MNVAIFYLTDSTSQATLYNYEHMKQLIDNSDKHGHEVNLYWAINKPLRDSISSDLDNINTIRVASEDIYNFGLFDANHHRPLWKNNDFFLYYLASRTKADFYIVLEGDYFINDTKYFDTLFSNVNDIDYVVANYWKTEADSDYFWKNYTSNSKLGYEDPYYLTSKNIMGAKNSVVDYLTSVRRNQSELTKDGAKIPNDNYFLGMELIKNEKLHGLFMNKQIQSMKLAWNDSKYYLDEDVLGYIGTIHPVRTAQAAIESNIQKKSMSIQDLQDESSYFNRVLLSAVKNENPNFYLSFSSVELLIHNLSDNDKLQLLSLLETKNLLPKLQTNGFVNSLFEAMIHGLNKRIKYALYTRYTGNQYPNQIRFNNLALFRPVSLSSSYKNSKGDLATDGNLNPSKYRDGGFHTDWEEEPFAIVDLENIRKISNIQINHRDGYFDRTTNLKVLTSLDGSQWDEVVDSNLTNIDWANLKSISKTNSKGFEFKLTISFNDRDARFIKIINTTKGRKPLHLNQIQIFG